jgi:hydrogenase maturation factor HypF (carbamoyltransferase family)
MHPNYVTTRIAEDLSKATGAPLKRVQHHHAHVASVMAEHDLNGPVIGIAFDGTGYGEDGNIWGGEFLLCQGATYQRVAHLAYIPMLGGDSSINEAWKSALCYKYAYESVGGKSGLDLYESPEACNNIGRDENIEGISETGETGEAGGTGETDGTGRTGETGGTGRTGGTRRTSETEDYPKQVKFDLSDIIDYNNRRIEGSNDIMRSSSFRLDKTVGYSGNNLSKEQYGRGAQEIQRHEQETVLAALKTGENVINSSSAGRLFDAAASLLGISHINRYEGECAIMLENAAMCGLKKPGSNEVWDLALKFHRDLAKCILDTCMWISCETGVTRIAMSGGVFQNRLLTNECLSLLRNEGFTVFYNISVPPNDGGISLGQAFLGLSR